MNDKSVEACQPKKELPVNLSWTLAIVEPGLQVQIHQRAGQEQGDAVDCVATDGGHERGLVANSDKVDGRPVLTCKQKFCDSADLCCRICAFVLVQKHGKVQSIVSSRVVSVDVNLRMIEQLQCHIMVTLE